MSIEKERAGLGFESELDNLDSVALTLTSGANDRTDVDRDIVRQTAEKEGFSSRESKPANKSEKKPKKEPTDQINFRAKVSVIEEFKALCESQEPKWPHGYTFERAIAALKRELKKG